MLSIGAGNATAVHRGGGHGPAGGVETIAAETDDVYRIDTYNSDGTRVLDNFPMFWQIPTIQAFQSVVSGSIFTFYDFLGIDRTSPPGGYLLYRAAGAHLDPIPLKLRGRGKTGTGRLPVMSRPKTTWTSTKTRIISRVGFAFDYYITDEDVSACPEGKLDRLLVKGLYLTDEQIAEYGDLLSPLPEGEGVPLSEDALAERRTTAGSRAAIPSSGTSRVLPLPSQAIPRNSSFSASRGIPAGRRPSTGSRSKSKTSTAG